MPMIDMSRWSRGGYAQQYPWAQCRYCGCAQDGDCAPVECLLCGSRQCFSNGLGNGSCAVCYVGWLPGWARSFKSKTCERARCEQEAVATVRKRSLCREHALVTKTGTVPVAEHITERVTHRDSGAGWEHWRWVA